MAQVGRQAAHFAAAVGNIEVFKLLVDTYKVSINATDKVILCYAYVCIHT